MNWRSQEIKMCLVEVFGALETNKDQVSESLIYYSSPKAWNLFSVSVFC